MNAKCSSDSLWFCLTALLVVALLCQLSSRKEGTSVLTLLRCSPASWMFFSRKFWQDKLWAAKAPWSIHSWLRRTLTCIGKKKEHFFINCVRWHYNNFTQFTCGYLSYCYSNLETLQIRKLAKTLNYNSDTGLGICCTRYKNGAHRFVLASYCHLNKSILLGKNWSTVFII